MAGKIKSIANPKIKLRVLTGDDIRSIHQATLTIIETVGVKFPSTKALDIWEANGATVDRSTMVVKAPGEMIEKALAKAPPSYNLCARIAEQDLPLDGKHVHLGTDGCGVEIIDISTGKRRQTTVSDVADIARVADFLPEVAFHWVAVSAQDCPPETRGLHELMAVWKSSTKHVQTESIYSEKEAKGSIEMAALLAGGRDALRARPILSMMQCTISPLAQDGGSIDSALVAAEAGIPTGFMSMASCAMTGPATLAGNLAVSNAEVISALALIQLAYPGAPVFYAAAQTAMDPRTGAYTGGGPEDFLFGAATNEIADFYNVPLSMGSFATGAKEPNWQAGVENSLSTFMASSVKSDMLLGVGLLNGSTIWSYEQMIMDCEIFSIVSRMMSGITVNDETLALDVIKEVGPGGSYLSHGHTRKHVRNLWKHTLLDRRPYNVWEKKKDNAIDWAGEKARQIFVSHHPKPLEAGLEEEMGKLVRSYEGEVCSQA